jgi:hypothetical protein
MRMLAVALFLLAAPAVSAQAARDPGCNRATARAAVKQTHLRMKLLGPDVVSVDASSIDQVHCLDFTRDGRIDIAASIASGGTAGDVGFVVFRASAAGWKVGLKGSGYKLGLVRLGPDVVVTQPIYKANDPNCCPTGGFDHRRFRWNGSRAVVVRSWHTRSFHP